VIEAGQAPGGCVAPGFQGVLNAFSAAVDGPGALAATVDGALVVDLWAGEGWDGDSATLLYSGTKGVAATVVLMLVEDGSLDLDEPVCRLWPEFAAAGKGEITVTELLAHAAGLAAVERPLERSDLHRPRQIAAALAAQAPMLPTGALTYHAVTWGWLAGELAVRATGRSLGALIRERLADPLGLDMRLGLPAADPLAQRLVRPVPAPGYSLSAFQAREPDPRLVAVYRNPALAMDAWCDPDLLAVEAPALNGIATARAVARLYGAVACGDLLHPATVARATEPAAAGFDALTGRPLRFGPAGHELAGTPSVLGPPTDAFGHTGAGGGSHGAWPSLRTGFSFITADLRSQDCDRRAAVLLSALHAAVAGP
jgi:CubicO group peptidase (beta-lactamase class C family)